MMHAEGDIVYMRVGNEVWSHRNVPGFWNDWRVTRCSNGFVYGEREHHGWHVGSWRKPSDMRALVDRIVSHQLVSPHARSIAYGILTRLTVLEDSSGVYDKRPLIERDVKRMVKELATLGTPLFTGEGL